MAVTSKESQIKERATFTKRICTIVLKYTLFVGLLTLVLLHFFIKSHTESKGTVESEKDIFYSNSEKYETLTWVVLLKKVSDVDSEDESTAKSIAEEIGLLNMGKVGRLPRHFLLAHPWHEHGLIWPGININKMKRNESKCWHQHLNIAKEWSKIKYSVNKNLSSHSKVIEFYQQSAVKRVKRFQKVFAIKRTLSSPEIEDGTHFNDPLFQKQWHLKNAMIPSHDMNVTGVWAKNITGRGITVAIVDDGLDWQSPDIRPNYNPEGSVDIVSNDNDPSPSNLKETNHHGTRCAGEIAAAANNNFCGVGIAHGARVSGIRLIEGPMTDDAEARAFSEKLSVNDIYSCSWGPEDNGKTMDGPHKLAMKALRLGTDFGRDGYGSIYVVASGNGGRMGDNCNYDGYANSIYTVTIGAVDEYGMMPNYSEECASMLAVAYSSGSSNGRTVVTSDWSLYGGSGCTEMHSGTSAAAPLAAGIIALMLEARPCLSWRDIQYLIVFTAVKIDVEGSIWTKNGAGLHHSHQHGFGIMDAWRLVNAAKVWRSVPWMTSFSTETNYSQLEIRSGQKVTCEVNVSKSDMDNIGLKTLEYVHLILTLSHEFRGQVEVQLLCPSGTSSILGATRSLDDSKDGLKDWIFSTVRCWGEEGHGLWTVLIIDHGKQNSSIIRGHIKKWRLQLYGSSLTATDISERIKLSGQAFDGKFLNSFFQVECDPAPVTMKVGKSISERYLKILIIVGAFIVIAAVSDTLEYALCYQKEKKDHHSNLFGLASLAGSPSHHQDGSDQVELQLQPLNGGSGEKKHERPESSDCFQHGGELSSSFGLNMENVSTVAHLVETKNDDNGNDNTDRKDKVHSCFQSEYFGNGDKTSPYRCTASDRYAENPAGLIKSFFSKFRKVPISSRVNANNASSSQVSSAHSMHLNLEKSPDQEDDDGDYEDGENVKLLKS